MPAEIALATDFGVGSLGYAAMFCLWGIGALIGAAAAARLRGRPRQVPVLGTAAVAIALGFLAISVAPWFSIVLFGMSVGGVGDGLWEVAQTSLIQRVTPDGIRSRVLAASGAIMQTGIAIGLIASGIVTDAGGATAAFGVAAVAAVIAVLMLYLRGLPAELAPAVTQASPSRPLEVKSNSASAGPGRFPKYPVPTSPLSPVGAVRNGR